jgi:hypothetical protein
LKQHPGGCSTGYREKQLEEILKSKALNKKSFKLHIYNTLEANQRLTMLP